MAPVENPTVVFAKRIPSVVAETKLCTEVFSEVPTFTSNVFAVELET